jgi:hypothetical protein
MTRRGPLAAYALAGLALATGCGAGGEPPAASSSPPNSTTACAGAHAVSLGRLGVSGAPAAARFTTDGGALYVTATGFPHGGAFDPKVGKTKVYIGPAATPATYDRQSNTVSHTRVAVDVEEGRPAPVTLPAGQWWLLSSWTVDITLYGCAASTITDVTPKP